jgi:hypothetical protein
VRGFSLNYTNSRLIHFSTVKDLVKDLSRKRKRDDQEDEDEEPPTKVIVTTNPSKITRDMTAGSSIIDQSPKNISWSTPNA